VSVSWQLEVAENKVEKRGVLLGPQKVTVNSPRLPRNSPQLHQQKTTFCTHFFSNPQQKH
jgi:hypothetical protein